MKTFEEWKKLLDLQPHPEGGFYRRTEESSEKVSLNGKERALYTSIYFLIREGNPSHFHRLTADEIWYYHAGESLSVHCIYPDGRFEEVRLGLDIANGERLHFTVPKGTIFGSSVPSGYSLVSCLVAPGFEFSDFELFTQADLLKDYPHYHEIIEKLAYKKLPEE